MYEGFIGWVEKIRNYSILDKSEDLYYVYVIDGEWCAHIHNFFKHYKH
ncbi:hypothetical protein NIES80_38470 [Dolichospermum planctonicum]|uniref:Uncharacterized protein n=1 Tax=Dolichospermum planctonicum TaxID=136072 RepID=A0A480AIB4_9CYAN|nr:hypothetical protein NIES80_38470 [Dolichospermum planctonicum]